jgi:hypothetical protein
VKDPSRWRPSPCTVTHSRSGASSFR